MKLIKLIILIFSLLFVLKGSIFAQEELRRPISPEQPMWLVHIDTWNWADPQKIIDLIPEDILPYVVFNISLSINWSSDERRWLVVEYGYETAKSWLRTCADNQVWAVIQPSSGGQSHFPDYNNPVDFENSLYAEFFRDYPNFLGFNYCEQFWGFESEDFPVTPAQRYEHFAGLLELSNRYGGYLINSFCPNPWNSNINAIGMLKRISGWEEASRRYSQNYLFFEKYTQESYIYEMESQALGTYLSGYSGGFGVRYDETGWTSADGTGSKHDFTLSTGLAPQFERFMFTGMTMIDGPELIFAESFRELGTATTSDGYTMRRWGAYPQFENVYYPMFRKVLDGTVRIPSRQEVIDRTKFVIIQDINSGNNDARYLSPPSLFEGLYRMDGDGNHNQNKTFYKKTGRYPTIPLVYRLNDQIANSFEFKINQFSYSNRWPTIEAKVEEFNTHFNQEYTGDVYAGRHENGWVIYNPYKQDQNASGSIPFKYNTADRMEVTFSRYTTAVVKEFENKLNIHINNYDRKVDNRLRTNTFRVHGSTNRPTYTFSDIGTNDQMESEITSDWTNGVFTLTIRQNGPIDIEINCSGNASNRLTSYTPATLIPPERPDFYAGPRQYEAEHWEYRSIVQNVTNGVNRGISNYTGQGYMNFGTNASARARAIINAPEEGIYTLETKYSVVESDINTIDLYVNGNRFRSLNFTSRSDLSDWGINTQEIELNSGANTIEFRATGTGANAIYFDNLLLKRDYTLTDLVEAVDIPGRIEAEKYSTMSGIRTENNTVGDGRHIGYINPDDWARYLIDVSVAGEYSLRVRVGTEADENNTITFKNESGATVVTVTVDASQTTGWQDWYIATANINLQAGEQELLVEFSGSTEFLYNIDWFEIAPLPIEIPGRIEAESFSAMSGIEVNTADNGSQSIGWINSGDWSSYLINVEEEGIYSLKFRVATGVDANNTITIRDESSTILGTFTVDESRSSGWSDWYIDSIVIDLNNGEQILTLEYSGTTEYLFDIDWFELNSATTSAVVFKEFEVSGYKVWSAPNPFVRDVKIFVRAESSKKNLKVELYNISGEKVFESKVRSNSAVSVSESENFKNGIYYIVLLNNSEKVALKSLLKIE